VFVRQVRFSMVRWSRAAGPAPAPVRRVPGALHRTRSVRPTRPQGAVSACRPTLVRS